jgi:hypothetical protein
MHMTGEPFAGFFDFVKKLLMAGTIEEVAALMASRPPLYEGASEEQ